MVRNPPGETLLEGEFRDTLPSLATLNARPRAQPPQVTGKMPNCALASSIGYGALVPEELEMTTPGGFVVSAADVGTCKLIWPGET
jgi:hypothetical protein